MKKRKILFLFIISLLFVACAKEEKSESEYTLSEPNKNIYQDQDEKMIASVSPMVDNDALIDIPEELGTNTNQDNKEVSFDFEDMNQLYIDYLSHEISIVNPWGEDTPISITFFKEYYDENTFTTPKVEYALIDLNNDGDDELVVFTHDEYGTSELIDIISIVNDELVYVDGYETHTNKMGTIICNNGVVCSETVFDDRKYELTYYDKNWNPVRLITLVKSENSETGLLYDYYYLNGNQDEKINISSDDELDSLLGKYANEPLDYFDITEYVESLEK